MEDATAGGNTTHLTPDTITNKTYDAATHIDTGGVANPTNGLADADHGNADVIRISKAASTTGHQHMGDATDYRNFFLTAGGRTATNGRLAATSVTRPTDENARNAEIEE